VIDRPVLLLLAVLFIGGCGPTVDATPVDPDPELIVGCVGIPAIACRGIADVVAAALPPGRGRPASLQLWTSGCGGPADCPPGVFAGRATAEWADGGAPVLIEFRGPPADLKLDPVEDATWSGLVQAKSQRVVPGNVVPFTLGHCGLLHVVDFDGSFWVPVGQVDPGDPPSINSADGQMQLVAPNRAQFATGGRVIATLARFPGPRHFWLCA
jgi:hypothetical protein